MGLSDAGDDEARDNSLLAATLNIFQKPVSTVNLIPAEIAIPIINLSRSLREKILRVLRGRKGKWLKLEEETNRTAQRDLMEMNGDQCLPLRKEESRM